MTALADRPGGRLVTQIATYAMGDVIVRAAAFVLLPLYTRVLSLEAFGVLGLVQMLEGVLVVVLNVGMSTAVMRRRARRDEALAADMFSAFVVIAGGGAAVLGLLATASERVSGLLFAGGLSPSLVSLVLAGIYFATIKLFIISILRADGRAVAYSAVNLLHFILLVGLSVIFVAGMDMGVAGAILGQALSAALVVIVLLPFAFGKMQPSFRAGPVKKLLAYGAPLMPGTLAVWVITMSNRLFLEHTRSMEEVGLYTLGFRVAMVLQIGLVTPFRTAWLPALFELDESDLSRVPRLVLSGFVAVGSGSALAVALFAPEIIHVVATDAYRSAGVIVPLLLVGYLLYGVYFNVDNGVVLSERTGVYPLVTGAAAAVNVALNAWLVPRYGLIGAAIATAASYPVLVALMYRASIRARRIPYDLGRSSAPLLVAAGLYIFALHVVPDAFRTAARVGALIAYPLILYLVGFFRESERQALRRLFARS